MKRAIIILINLIIGNLILFIGAKNTGSNEVNYPLMAGMSLACIAYYLLFFRFTHYRNFGIIKLLLVSIFGCMVILLAGNALGIIFKGGLEGGLWDMPALILMGIVGNIIMFPLIIVFGVMNFLLIKSLRPQ